MLKKLPNSFHIITIKKPAFMQQCTSTREFPDNNVKLFISTVVISTIICNDSVPRNCLNSECAVG